MKRVHVLFHLLLITLAARGLSPDGLDGWRGWMAFREFALSVHEAPDPGVSVQITPDPSEDAVRLVLMRQVTESRGDCLHPVGAVVCELTFAQTAEHVAEWDAWSFDYPTFERFVNAVEEHPVFQELIVRRPLASTVYWQAV
jgi:hypothetical protein